MNFLIADVLLNFLLILTPLYFFQFTFSNYTSIGARIFLGLLLGIAAILCMFFPMVSGDGFLWDLRWVALLISVLYGGLVSGGITATLIILFRFSLGGLQGAVIVVFVAIVLIIIFLYVRKGFQKLSFKQRILMSGGLGIIAWGIAVAGIVIHFALIGSLRGLQEIAFPVFGSMFILYLFSSVTFIYFSENMRHYTTLKNEALTKEKVNYITEVGEILGARLNTHLVNAENQLQELKSTARPSDLTHIHAIERELDILNQALSNYTSENEQLITDSMKPLTVIATEVCEILQPYAKQKEVDVTLDLDIPYTLEIRHLQMKQILVNMVKNALDATPKHGQVTLSCLIKRGWLYIYIDDTGIGIAQHQLAGLMDLNYTSANSIAGQGLRVTQQLVRELDGTFSIKSQIQKGTTVTLKFPL